MGDTLNSQIEALQKAIVAQEGLRTTLGDAAVDATIAVLKEKLTALEKQQSHSQQQRKLATVLMADVSGFTAMSEAMDAEEVTDVMNALWGVLDKAILQHGGLIDKHMGDAVMALWGADEAHEDDPENAIRAALDMQAALAQFREDYQAELKMRIGINTGPVLLGQVGTTGEFTAMGDTVNLVSRLEHAAPVDGILVSHGTYRHVRGIFDAAAQEPLLVKGKTEPVQTYVVQRAKPRAFRTVTRGVEGIETRMIGRDAELLALQNAYQTTWDEAKTTLILIVGEAGVGKSRLLYEFDNWIELRPEEIWFFKGRASPQMRTTAYSLFRDMFRNRFDILESDDVAVVLKKFRAGMKGILDIDQAELVGHLIGFDFSASPIVSSLLDSPSFGKLATAYLTNYFRKLVDEPAVMFLEDLHWADDSSLHLVTHLLQEIPDGKLLIVGLTRPVFFEKHADWGDTFERVDLQPLSDADSEVLVEEVLQRMAVIPGDLRQLIVNGAEGNPFYVEELIKMLIEDGVIQRHEGEWHVEMQRLTVLHVPSTLTGVLQARLDRLPSDERVTLQHASVVGRLFWDAAVANLADKETDVATHIQELQRRELVFPHERSAFSDADEFIFKHAILRDVTYETVLLKLRHIYHAQVAAWLEEYAGGRVGEVLNLIAGHYEQAGENERAVDYLQRAAEALYRVSDFRGALATLEHALALTDDQDMARRARLLVRMGRAHENLSDYPTATRYLEQGLSLARSAHEESTEVLGLNWMGRVLQRTGDHVKAEEYGRQALELAQKTGDELGIAMSWDSLGKTALKTGAYETAQEYFESSLVITRKIGDRRGTANSLHNLGVVANDQGDFERAREFYEESIAIRREMGDLIGVAASLNNLGNVAIDLEEFETAQKHLEDSLSIKRDIADRAGIADSLHNLGVLFYVSGSLDLSQQYLEESLVIEREIGEQAGIGITLGNLGVIAMERGDLENARRFHEEALTIKREVGDRVGVAITLKELGHLSVATEKSREAWRYYKESLRMSLETGFGAVIPDVIAGVARLYAQADNLERAAELLGLVVHHPSTLPETKTYRVEPLLATLRGVMSTDELEAAQERGQTLELDDVVSTILSATGDEE